MDVRLFGEIALLGVALVALVVFGILLIRGNERCFRLLAGGRNFLGLDPTEAEYRRTAVESGVAVFLIALLLLCAVGEDVAEGLGCNGPAIAAATAAVPAVTALSVIGLLAIVVVQIARHARLLNRKE